MKINYSYFDKIQSFLGLEDNVKAFFRCALDKIVLVEESKKIFCRLLSEYDVSFDMEIDYSENEIKKIANFSSVAVETIRYVLYVLMFEKLEYYYVQKGYPISMYQDAIVDFTVRINECYKLRGVYGLLNFWSLRFLRLEVFAVGRLQYNFREISADYKLNEVEYKKGDKVIGVHIPPGKPLDMADVQDSFDKAAEFFKKFFGYKIVPFVCRTYLFHPSMVSLYKEGSNLLKFYRLFDVYFDTYYDHIEDAWRIFNVESNDVASFPENTSLQKGLKQYLLNGGKMGAGEGILLKK